MEIVQVTSREKNSSWLLESLVIDRAEFFERKSQD